MLWSTALAVACGPAEESGEGAALALTIEPSPPRAGESEVSLVLTDESGEPLEHATVRLEGNMNHAGMTPEFADATEVAPGRYRAELEFTMGGDWILLVEATTPEGETHHWQHDVPGVLAD